MDFRVLGCVEVAIGGRPVQLTSAKQRAVLAAGLLSANQVVSVSRLIDAVWGDAPPATAAALVQTYVSALRRVLHHPPQPAVIATRTPGYLIRVQPGQLDLHRFEELLADGRAAASRGDGRAAVESFRAALAQWRGPALHGLASPALTTEAVRLDEMRLTAVEECAAVQLQLGPLEPLIAELSALVAGHPLRERLRSLLMRALCRVGRQAEALEVYRQGCSVLRGELGIEPGPELQQLHLAVLAADPSLSPPQTIRLSQPQGAAPATARSPQQLPPAIDALVGRDVELSAVTARLRSAAGADRPVVCAISGMAGSGKTALALSAAHLVRDAFPDGQLFVALPGPDVAGNAPPREAVDALLRTLGAAPTGPLESVAEAAAVLRDQLAGRRALLVVDGVVAEAQVRPLLPAHAGAAVLVTSRAVLAGLDCQAHWDLGVLASKDATTLLARVAGEQRVRAEPAATREIVRCCAGLPLAIRAAGARLASRPRWSLAVLAARLADEDRRLDELTVGDLDVRRSLELSYRALPELARSAFRTLGALGLSSVSPRLLAHLAEVSITEADRLADRLADVRLLDHVGAGTDGQVRYQMHSLVQLYARERAKADQTGLAQDWPAWSKMDPLLIGGGPGGPPNGRA